MSYIPHTWTTGETITAERLNALEEGVASGASGEGIANLYDFAFCGYYSEEAGQTVYEVIQGDQPTIRNKILNGEYVTGLYQEKYISGGLTEVYSAITYRVAAFTDGPDIELTIYRQWNTSQAFFYWLSDGSIVID